MFSGHMQDQETSGSFDSQTTVPWAGGSESQAANCTLLGDLSQWV